MTQINWPDPNCGYIWTNIEWQQWRECNIQVVLLGGKIGTDYLVNGKIEEWIEIDGIRSIHNPQWVSQEPIPHRTITGS